MDAREMVGRALCGVRALATRFATGLARPLVGTAAGKLLAVAALVSVVFVASGARQEGEASSSALATLAVAPDTDAKTGADWGPEGEPDTSATAPADAGIDQDSVDEANPADEVPAVSPEGDEGSVDDFLTHSNGGTLDESVVVTACRAAGKMTELMGQLQSTFGAVKSGIDMVRSIGAGLPVMDPIASAAASSAAAAARRGSAAEQWAATFGASALCNTSETKRLTKAHFDFLRNVVNRGIEQPLPKMDNVLAQLDSVVHPIAATVREDRIGRLFGRARNSGQTLAQGTADAAADTAVWAAHEAMKAADSMAVIAARKIREFEAELNQSPQIVQGKPACFHLDAEGDTAWVALQTGQTQCTASPGRMQQLMAAEASLNNAQLLHINTLTARRMDLDYTRYQIELRERLLERATAPMRAAW